MEMKTSSIVVQYAAGISAGCSAAAAGMWLAWPSSTIAVLEDPAWLNMTTSEISILVSIMDLGNVLSPIPSGYLMDGVGRKLTLYMTGIIYLASVVLAIIGSRVWMLYLARLLAGIGKGVAFAVTPVFLGEIADKRLRGALSTCFIGLLNFGMCFDYIYGSFVSYTALNWLNLAIPWFFISSFWIFPESPYYLVMKGREGSARGSLKFYRMISKNNEDEKIQLDKELENTKRSVERDMQNKSRFVDVFKGKANRRALLIIVMLAIFQRLSGISPTLAYSTKILPEDGAGISKHMYMIMFASILTIANFSAIPLVDKSGRKPLLMYSSITSAIAMGGAGYFYYLQHNGGGQSIQWLPYVCMLAFGATYSVGIGFLPSTLVGELFPTNVRSHAGSISAILLAATSFGVNSVFLIVTNVAGVHMMYAVFTVSCLLCAVFVHFCVIETKGKTFLEIQDILHNKEARPI